MKKGFLILSLMVVMVASVVLVGCAKAPGASQPAGIPDEPAGAYPQPNPYWGLGYKPDGTQYQFAALAAHLKEEWQMTSATVCANGLKMSGADVDFHNANFVLDEQIAQIEAAIEKNVDAITINPVDSAGTAPAIDKCGQAGIPVFTLGVTSSSSYVTCNVAYDYAKQAASMGDVIVAQAEELGKHLYVYELWCPMSYSVCVDRSNAFNEAVKDNPLITVTQGPPCEALDDLAMNAIMDAFPAHPELNAICLEGGMYAGTKEALKALNRWYPVGNPDHVVWTGCDGFPVAVEASRDGYIDGIGLNSPWAVGDTAAKLVLNHVCLGESVPEKLWLPEEPVTPKNVGTSPYGGPMRWGFMLTEEPDLSKWPLLDMTKYGIETPTYTAK